MTGYELRQAITTVLGHFWHESFGQIYPTLADLEEEGHVTASPGDRANSRRFTITDAGRIALRDLLKEPPTPQPPRNGTLLRVFFGPALGAEALVALLDSEEADVRSRLATYAAIRDGLMAEAEHPDHVPYWLATVRAGELTAAAQLQWLQETRAALLPPATLPPS
jgi:DNA-binding PadR family transcriptional regulator